MLQALRPRISGKQVVLVGVGNSLRGDDGAGSALVQRLQGKLFWALIDASDVPENYLGVVKAAQPDVVVIVDAVELGAAPGDTAIIESEQLAVTRLTTHNASLALVAEVIRRETSADIFLLAIQPASTALGSSMSVQVKRTVEMLERMFLEL